MIVSKQQEQDLSLVISDFSPGPERGLELLGNNNGAPRPLLEARPRTELENLRDHGGALHGPGLPVCGRWVRLLGPDSHQ